MNPDLSTGPWWIEWDNLVVGPVSPMEFADSLYRCRTLIGPVVDRTETKLRRAIRNHSRPRLKRRRYLYWGHQIDRLIERSFNLTPANHLIVDNFDHS